MLTFPGSSHPPEQRWTPMLHTLWGSRTGCWGHPGKFLRALRAEWPRSILILGRILVFGPAEGPPGPSFSRLAPPKHAGWCGQIDFRSILARDRETFGFSIPLSIWAAERVTHCTPQSAQGCLQPRPPPRLAVAAAIVAAVAAVATAAARAEDPATKV